MSEQASITFLASLPDIQSAVKVGQDTMRVQFDIPETEKANAVPLLALFGVVLRVTVQVEHEGFSSGSERQPPKRRKAKKRVVPGDPGL